jgi:hypothetical protein
MQELTVHIINTYTRKRKMIDSILSLSMRITRMCYLIYRKDQSRSGFHRNYSQMISKLTKKWELDLRYNLLLFLLSEIKKKNEVTLL